MLGALLGNYRVVEELSEGDMGVLYLGRHETLSRRVVVKVLQPELSRNAEMVQRFFKEAQAATAIRNPGIVQIFDYGTAPDGRAYFVMELLEGQSLAARLGQRRVDSLECCRIGRQVANVLQAAHAAGITHRNLRPDNLFLIPDPEVIGGERVKVLDFGIAKLASEAHASGVRTRTGLEISSPTYMSPEQCRSFRNADARSDIYSLGCILFEMACGRPPFVSKGMGEVIAAHLHAPPPHPQSLAPDMPPGLAGLIANMLSKDAEARPQKMAVVAQELDEILHKLGGPPPRAPTARAPTPTPLPVPATRPPDSTLTTAPDSTLHDPTLFEPTMPPEREPTTLPVARQPMPQLAPPTPVPQPQPWPPGPVPPHIAPLSPPAPPFAGWAGTSGSYPRAGTRRLPFVLGGLVIVGAIVAIAIVLATRGAGEPAPTTSPGDTPAVPAPAEAAPSSKTAPR